VGRAVESDAPRERARQAARPAARTAAAAAALLLLLLLVAIASGARGRGELEPAPRGVPTGMFDYLFTIGIVVLVGLVVLTLLLFRNPFTPPEHDPTGFWRVALFMLFIAALGYVAMRGGFGSGVMEGLQELTERQEEAGREGQRQQQRDVEPLQVKWEVFAVTAALAGVAGVVYLRRRLRKGRPLLRLSVAEEVAEVLDETLDDLHAERDARRAVIAAYARMERTLAVHGLPRRPAEAPLEFLGRVLSHLRVPAAAALDLTSLFERAKFSLHPVDAAMKDEAIAALSAVRDDLRAAA
jgi:hypothetical protein